MMIWKKIYIWKIAIELYKQPKLKATEKEHIRLVLHPVGVEMVVKTDDEIHVLSIMKDYDYFSFILSALPKKVELLKMSKVLQLFENRYHHGKVLIRRE